MYKKPKRRKNKILFYFCSKKPKKAVKKKPTRKSIFEIYEPSELKRGHFTDLDNEVSYNIRSCPIGNALAYNCVLKIFTK